MAQVTLKNVSKTFPNAACSPEGGAVRDLTLDVQDREFVVLVGSPGCGNSTVLRLIAGLDPITSGEIVIGNRPVNTLAPEARDVAMVFSQYALFPHWTAFANIAFGLKGRHFPKTEIDKRVREAAGVAGVAAELLERKPQALSPVEQLRVALARAIVRQPKVILCDDPLASLDADARAAMRAELVKLQERIQTTVIYATHDPLEAMTLGHRIALMREGGIEQFGAPLEIYNKPANLFTAGFLGQPKMNLIGGRLRAAQDGVVFKETDGTVEVKLAESAELRDRVGKDVVLGIRPEDVKPVQSADIKARGARCQGIVDHVEATGAEVVYYVQTGAHTVAILSGASAEPGGAGRRMPFDIDPEKVHLFDAETAVRIV